MQKKVLIVGEHSYIGNSFKKYMEREAGKPAATAANSVALGDTTESDSNQESGSRSESSLNPESSLELQGSLKIETVGAANGAWKQADLSQYAAVLHVAAIVHQKEPKSRKQLYMDVNTRLPVEIAKKAKASGVRQFIFLSTMAVYGEVEGAITEETPLNPATMYGKTKLAAERKLQKLNSDQFKVAILRPPMVYGENCPGNYTRLKKLAKYLPVFPDVDNKRSMIHIDNLSRCIALLIEKEHAGILCPSDEQPVKTTDLYVQLRKSMGKKTWTTRAFNWLVMAAKGKVGSVNKLFGSCYYELSMNFVDIDNDKVN